jgi:nitrite reductase/ring-hydroxylating ferredoxin subunit
MFLEQSWYVLGWSHEVAAEGAPLGRVVIGQPIVVWRDGAGRLHAAENRCPHRHAPLSLGQVRGDRLVCMYHGMAFGTDGRCRHMPLMEQAPDVAIRIYPVVEKNDWIWVWTGRAEWADPSLIPDAHGIHDPARPMRSNSIEYDAHYQLVHDNLCDLSHVDFVHRDSLQPATGANWSETAPRILSRDRAVRFERWFENAVLPGGAGEVVDTWSSYDFALPGIFIMYGARFPRGTAARCGYRAPDGVRPLVENIEQQAVTPISATRTAYHYATGLVGSSAEVTAKLAARIDVVMKTFEEDRIIIEAQQRIWDLTPPEVPKLFVPQDKGPFLMRRLIDRALREEQARLAA